MEIGELKERAAAAWDSFSSAIETLCLWIIGIGVLALVLHSWILLSNGKTREALGALICAVAGAAGAVLFVERWIAAAQAAVFALGFLWGRSERAQCGRSVVLHAALAALWWALLAYGGPIVLGFGFPAAGLEEKIMWVSFWVVLVNHVVRAPGRLRVSWRAVSTPAASAGDSLPPIGGAKF